MFLHSVGTKGMKSSCVASSVLAKRGNFARVCSTCSDVVNQNDEIEVKLGKPTNSVSHNSTDTGKPNEYTSICIKAILFV